MDHPAWVNYWCEQTPENLNAVVELYIPLVENIAKKFHKNGRAYQLGLVDYPDSVQNGILGLRQAIEKFDRTRNLLFSTYAVARIRGAILDGIRDVDWVPRLVRSQKEETVRMSNYGTIHVVSDDNGGEFRMANPFDALRSNEPDPTDNPEEFWQDVLKGCSKNERIIILSYYRLDMSMKEIGKSLGLSESRVSQMHSALLSRLATLKHAQAALKDYAEESRVQSGTHRKTVFI